MLTGLPIGLLVGIFNMVLGKANNFRKDHEFLVYLLPVAGLIICYMYLHTKRNAYSGENLLKSEVQSAAENIPLYMILVVSIGSLLTTFFGGSAGKEGSAIAIGGTIADFISRILKLDKDKQRILVICGVGSAFGVIYDVPFAGAILGMELVLKGKFHYQALIPAFLTSVISNEISYLVGKEEIVYPQLDLGALNFLLIMKLILLGLAFGVVGFIFNYILDNSSKVYSKFTKNPYIKALLGGILTIVLFMLLGQNFNGLGTSYIAESFEKSVSIFDWIWKILFTAIALGSVFQGGRGNPTFFVGATFASAIAPIINLPLKSVTALGMIGVFCSATALPITSIIMALEYFGSNEVIAIIIVMTMSYVISGIYDIVTKNKINSEKKEIISGEI